MERHKLISAWRYMSAKIAMRVGWDDTQRIKTNLTLECICLLVQLLKACIDISQNDVNGGEQISILIMLTCLKLHRAAIAERFKSVLGFRTAATSIQRTSLVGVDRHRLQSHL